MLTTSIREAIVEHRRRVRDAGGMPERALRGVSREVADRAVAGELGFRHLGVRYFQIGRRDIAWAGPHQAHQEWPAQLNRFFHLPSLAAAYLETGDAQYADAARDYLLDWIRAHPTRADWAIAPYDNTLNLCIRAVQWTAVLPVFVASPAFDDATVEAILGSLAAQLAFLSTHLAPGSNWRIAHVDALLTCGLSLPFLPGAADWRALAVRVLNDAYHRQILPDGAHIERTPGYHGWMTEVFQRLWRIGRAMPELGLAMRAEPIARMHDYHVGMALPNGSANGLHDSNSRRTGEPDRAGLDRRAAFRREAGLPEELPPTAQFFAAAGQACLRDSWEPDAVYVTFDATTWGGAHCHLSRNAVQLAAYGRHLLLDPGTLTYEVSDPKMAGGKSTRAHNTLNLNGWNQSYANPTGTRCHSLPGYDFIASQYEGGYWPGEYTWGWWDGHGAGLYAEHHRALLWVRDRCVIIIDHLRKDHGTAPLLESNWQLADGPVEVGADRAVTRHQDANLLLLFPLLVPAMTLTVHEGESDPPRGWLPGDGAYVPAPQLCLSAPRMETLDASLLTVLIPFRGPDAPGVIAHAALDDGTGLQRLRLEWADGSADELYATPRLEIAIGQDGELDTDAALLHLQRDPAGRVTRGLVVDGTYARPFTETVKAEMGVWGC
ncbi:MAG TPA: heparinase II/III family protein [Armatimonadota bacterium]|nr:heparinase II/III family protein [Armatimonadota bacterium]